MRATLTAATVPSAATTVPTAVIQSVVASARRLGTPQVYDRGEAVRRRYDPHMSAPLPEHFATAAEYRWARKLWRRKHGGSMVANVAVAAIAGGIAGSQVAVVAFIALAVVVTLARRTGV